MRNTDRLISQPRTSHKHQTPIENTNQLASETHFHRKHHASYRAFAGKLPMHLRPQTHTVQYHDYRRDRCIARTARTTTTWLRWQDRGIPTMENSRKRPCSMANLTDGS
jgi:hypothetical protein